MPFSLTRKDGELQREERRRMVHWGKWHIWMLPVLFCALAHAQTTQQLIQQAVNTELHDDAQDHSHWLFFEVDKKPTNTVEQWVAETAQGDLTSVVAKNGQTFTKQQQRNKMNTFINNSAALAKQRKGSQHDDSQARQMLSMLPNAFIWTKESTHDGDTVFDFKPNPQFNPPTWESRVFAAMAGEMTVNDQQHRIVSLKGRMIHNVKFLFGLLGVLKAGGSFDVERRQLAPGIWKITQTHVHIQGYALIFKSISEQEDDVKWAFKQLPQNVSFTQAENEILQQPQHPK